MMAWAPPLYPSALVAERKIKAVLWLCMQTVIQGLLFKLVLGGINVIRCVFKKYMNNVRG